MCETECFSFETERTLSFECVCVCVCLLERENPSSPHPKLPSPPLSMAAATPPSPVDWTWPAKPPTHTSRRGSSPPLELQLLPPAAPFTASESPWGLDPSRLQQLMMGSAPGASPVSNAPSTCGSVRDLGALFDDNGTSKPLPSGWERCLDLQSGEMFLKKSDAAAKGLHTPCSPHLEQVKDWKQSGIETSKWQEAFSTTHEHRQDWSRRWQGEMILTSQHEAMLARKSFASPSATLGRDSPNLPDREPLGLDLDLRLTNEKRNKVSFEAQDATSMRPSNGIAPGRASNQSCVQESIQPWKWQQCVNGSEKPASIQEMARESTMVTAVCSKCLMYVLLRKSSPICPRCSVPIVLDGGLASAVSKKRPRLALSPDVLSFSTDSSR